MVTADKYFGGIAQLTLASSPIKTVNPQRAKFWTVTAPSNGLQCRMVNPSTGYQREPMGLAPVYIWNAGEDSFEVRDHAGTLIVTVDSDEVGIVHLASASGVQFSAAGSNWVWFGQVKERGS
jgi:hypothetical protein